MQALPALLYVPIAPPPPASTTNLALIVPLAVVLPLLLVAAAVAALLLRRRRRRGRARGQTAQLKKTMSGVSGRSRARLKKQTSAPTGLTSFDGTMGSGEPNAKLPMPALPSKLPPLEPSGAITASPDTTPRASTVHFSAKLSDGAARATPADSSVRLGGGVAPRSASASVRLRLTAGALPPTTDFTSDCTPGSFPTTTMAQALTSISSANPVDALEDALDTLYISRQPFREHYEILSSVERRTGGRVRGCRLSLCFALPDARKCSSQSAYVAHVVLVQFVISSDTCARTETQPQHRYMHVQASCNLRGRQ